MDDKRQSRLLPFCVVFTAITLFGFSFEVYRTYQFHHSSTQRSVEIDSLRGTITHLDEVLTMSARMAAMSGDLAWEKRYREYELVLDKAIQRAIELVPSAATGEGAEQTNRANKALVAMENQAFDLVRQSQPEQAKQVLFGLPYQEQKKIYAEGMYEFNQQLQHEMDQTSFREARRAMFQIFVLLGISGLLVFVWVLVMRFTNRWQNKLEEVNRSLDQKVMERTRELEQSQAKLVQAQKMESLGQLSASVAHDLNNQLTPVRGYLDMILATIDAKNENYEALQEVNQAAIRSIEIVQRLVNFSKPSSQKKSMMRVEPLIEEIKKMLPHILPATIDCRVIVQPGLWSITGNDSELQSMVMNLISNARDAMPDGGRITLRVENAQVGGVTVSHGVLTKPHVAISVVDTGSGMTPEVMQRLFEPFFSTKGRAKGTGLGLSMAFNTVRDHGGWLDVSTEIGKGSAFQVYVPAELDARQLKEAETLSTPSIRSTMEGIPHGSGLILFVDDEERIRTMGKAFLELLGYTVMQAKDGSDAVEKYMENKAQITAVVSDMTMPRMGGRQMLLEILGISPKAIVVLSSGYTDDGTHDDLVKLGAAEFIQKPYTIQILATTLQKCLSKK